MSKHTAKDLFAPGAGRMTGVSHTANSNRSGTGPHARPGVGTPASGATPSGPELAQAHLTEAIAIHDEVGRIMSAIDALAPRIEAISVGAFSLVEAARDDLIRAVMAASPRPLPEDEEWYRPGSAIWTHRAGSRIFALARNGEDDTPKDQDEATRRVVLVVLDDAEAR